MHFASSYIFISILIPFPNKTLDKDLEQYFLDMGEKKFKALQVFEWLYTHKVTSFFEMTNIKKEIQ